MTTEKEHADELVLAASRGTLEGLTTTAHLVTAIGKYRYAARTATGDAFETAFLWAREEKAKLGTAGRAQEVVAEIKGKLEDKLKKQKDALAKEKLGTPGEYLTNGRIDALEDALEAISVAGPAVDEKWSQRDGVVLLRWKGEHEEIPLLRAGYDPILDVWWAALEVEKTELRDAEDFGPPYRSTFRGITGQTRPGKGLEHVLANMIAGLAKHAGMKPWTEYVEALPKTRATIFECPKCHKVSHNPNDVANRYCGVCGFVDDVPRPRFSG